MRATPRLTVRMSFLLLFILVGQLLYSQTNGEIISVKGEIGNQFHLSSTHNIDERHRVEFLSEVEPILDKIDLLDKYYSFENQGRTNDARELLESDSTLADANMFGLGYGYMIAKMKELDILFQPLIQCEGYGESYLISLTEEELIALEDYLNKGREVGLVIERIGVMEMDQTDVFKLQGVKD
ncbi:MAG: hypothetical protein AAFZ63_16120 [Bacteroidota bacterium]